MIKINLLPQELQAVQKRQRMKSCVQKIIFLLVVLLIIVSLLLWVQTKRIKQEAGLIAEQRANWEEEIAFYETAISLDRQAKHKKNILQQAIGSSFDWAQFMQGILASAAEGIRLTKLVASREDKQVLVNIEGVADHYTDLSQWVLLLKSTSGISEVHVISTKKLESLKQVQFTVRIITGDGKPYEP
ncbi:MAG: PilN domain-containing protein [Firmicutes bacterium]|nr:PilN domain-containing protein [Bacillota bacterium]